MDFFRTPINSSTNLNKMGLSKSSDMAFFFKITVKTYLYCINLHTIACISTFEDTAIICEHRPRGYKTFFMLNSIEHEIFPHINVKMPTIVGILTCMSGKNNILGLTEP